MARHDGRSPVRLRVAFHEGVTTLAADGFGGRAVTRVRQQVPDSGRAPASTAWLYLAG